MNQVHNLHYILLVFSFACFGLAAYPSEHWQKLMAAGLAFLVASMIF